jgi:hypothetical protein
MALPWCATGLPVLVWIVLAAKDRQFHVAWRLNPKENNRESTGKPVAPDEPIN